MSIKLPRIVSITIMVDDVQYWFNVNLDTKTAAHSGAGPIFGPVTREMEAKKVDAGQFLITMLALSDWTVDVS